MSNDSVDQIDFVKLFTQRKFQFPEQYDDSRGWDQPAREMTTTMPLSKWGDQPLFANFEPTRRKQQPLAFQPDHHIIFEPGPIWVHPNIMRTPLTGRWSARRRECREYSSTAGLGRWGRRRQTSSTPKLELWFENDSDFIIMRCAGVINKDCDVRTTRDRDREHAKTWRHLSFTVSERRRLLQLLEQAKRHGESLRAYSNRAVDEALLRKIT